MRKTLLRNQILLKKSTEEYESILKENKEILDLHENSYWSDILAKLQTDCEWTQEGAIHLIQLVNDYGSFMLRNALALAIAADIEDGKLGL